MAGSTPVSSLPYAQLADSPNANTLSQGIATALDHIVIPKYATTTARDAANTVPVEGDMCYVSLAGTTNGYYTYSGSAWIGPLEFNSNWTTYTTTWNTSTGLHTPSLGNGNQTFRYLRLGSICFVNFGLVMGSTTNFNSGGTADNWQFTLPFTCKTTTAYIGAVTAENTAGTDWPCTVQVTASSNIFTLQNTGAGVASNGATTSGTNGGVIDSLTPFTWAASSANFFKGQFFYEV